MQERGEVSGRWRNWVLAALMAGAGLAGAAPLPGPPAGKYYHGIYPGGVSGEEDDITAADLASYEKTVGARAAWVYFSDNWYAGRKFPMETARWIGATGAVPFIRLMLRSEDHDIDEPERFFSLQKIIDGKFDADLIAWGAQAKAYGGPLIVEYGTEVNATWFGWNGSFHGGGKKTGFGDPKKADGPERFVAAYRHIVEKIREGGAEKITWVFHIDTSEDPETNWNRLENYYPGDDVVDWLGVSDYGALTPKTEEDDVLTFREKFDPIYARLVALAPTKPIMVLEFGSAERNRYAEPGKWAAAALGDLLSDRWPQVGGFSWWNERWENDDTKGHDTTMRVQDIPALAEVFRTVLEEKRAKILERIPGS